MIYIDKYIVTDSLPRQSRGVDWENCSGMKVPFKYMDVEGEFEIIKYDKFKKCIYFKYNNIELNSNITAFLNCSLGVKLGLISRCDSINFKYEVGEKINRDKYYFTILDRKVTINKRKDGYNSYTKMYKRQCSCCKNVKWLNESNLKRGGCSSCNQFLNSVNETNSIIINAPWMIKYFQGGYEEAKNYSVHSNKKITPICPDCGRVKNGKSRIGDIYKNHSIGCSCSDKISYPEKLMCNILEQLGVDFEWQLSKSSFDWCGDYRYDFYDKNLNMIIETHGAQHGKINGWKITLEEQINIDKNKKILALKNNINTYIELDCFESDLDYIKKSILDSYLPKIYDLSTINWYEADKFALGNFTKLICEYFEINKDVLLMKEIAKNLNISTTTLVSYVKKGNKYKWCNYDPKYMHKINNKKRKYKNCKYVYFKELNQVFLSARQISDFSELLVGTKLKSNKIQLVCSGVYENHIGFHFSYIEKDNLDKKYNVVKCIGDVNEIISDDWIKYSNNYTTSVLIKNICNYYEENKKYVYMCDIAKKFNIGMVALIKYLKKGNELGICNYIPSK